eukprot:14366383-Ditylum_brightwellii.AAC.1
MGVILDKNDENVVLCPAMVYVGFYMGLVLFVGADSQQNSQQNSTNTINNGSRVFYAATIAFFLPLVQQVPVPLFPLARATNVRDNYNDA